MVRVLGAGGDGSEVLKRNLPAGNQSINQSVDFDGLRPHRPIYQKAGGREGSRPGSAKERVSTVEFSHRVFFRSYVLISFRFFLFAYP